MSTPLQPTLLTAEAEDRSDLLDRVPHPTTLSFLFTDIEGSTRQWETESTMGRQVDEHFSILRQAVETRGGEIFATLGDGIAAAFPSADAAVQAAIGAQRRLPVTGLRVRMGIHTGEVDRVEGDLRGRAVNRASRIAAAGHGGQILLSDLAMHLVRQGPNPVDVADLGALVLRGLDEPERIWQVVHGDLLVRFPPIAGARDTGVVPTHRSPVVGRHAELERVTGLLEDHRIVTLTGVGGVGKTHLAVRVAAECAARFSTVRFVELAGLADAEEVGAVLAQTLGIAAFDDAATAASSMLGMGRSLLIVDNCEHVIDVAARVIDTIVLANPGLSVLATSREALDIDGECVVPIRPLDLTTAAELFVQRAIETGASAAALDGAIVETICRRLDGIPLAVELAAARAASLGTAVIADALDDRFSLLKGGHRRAVDRHATMRSTIDWSYRLLDAREQRFFQWMTVFGNGFELDAALAVAATMGVEADDATEVVASLVRKSIIVSEPSRHGPRYRVLETMRAYGLERLEAAGERLAAGRAQAEWVATITDLPPAEPCNATVERAAIRLDREGDSWRDAVTLALRLSDAELAGRLCGPPAAYCLLGRHDLVDLLGRVLALEALGVSHRRTVLCALIAAGAGVEPTARLDAWVDEVVSLDRVDPTGLGELIRWLTFAWRGDFRAAVETCVEASDDPRLAQSTRDLFVGFATLDHFSLATNSSDPLHLAERALAVAARSDVAMHRVTCRLGAAWKLAWTDPDRSVRLVCLTVGDVVHLPPLTRVTLPGSASRLLASLDPRVVARGLLEQIESVPAGRSFADLIPLFYATALLERLGHPAAHPLLARLGMPGTGAHLSMMDHIDIARSVCAFTDGTSLAGLEALVLASLADVVDGVSTISPGGDPSSTP